MLLLRKMRAVSRKSRILVISILILCCVALIYFFPKGLIPPYTYDDSIVTGNPCTLPCWQGLLVGESSYQDVEQFLRGSNFVPIELITMNATRIQWTWNIFHRGTFAFDDNTLISMSIAPNYKFPVTKVFDILGEPEAVRGRGSMFDQRPILELDLFYPTQGVLIHTFFEINDIDNIAIPNELQGISFAVYSPASDLSSFVTTMFPNWKVKVDQIIDTEFYDGWPGFGAVVTVQQGNSIWFDTLIYVTPAPQ